MRLLPYVSIRDNHHDLQKAENMITSTSNSKIKNIIQLMTSSKARREQQSFVVEGMKLFQEAPAKQIRQILLTESCLEKIDNKEKLAGLEYELVSDTVYKKMSDTKTPQGILCVIRMEKYELEKLLKTLKGQAVHILISEGIQDPGNLGTIVRTGEGAGINLVLADEKTVDVYNPKVIRSTMGSIFRVPIVYTTNLREAISILKRENIVLYAAHLNGKNDFWKETYSDRTAVLIGNEGNGLSEETSEQADVLVKIPMLGNVESLNAAVAAAVLMYEIRRQTR